MPNILENYDALVDKYNQMDECYHQNMLWYMLCLSLCKDREAVEERAKVLADKHGLLKALKLLRKRKKGIK